MKKKYIVLISVLLVIAIVVTGIACSAVWRMLTSYSPALKANWGFSLPCSARWTQVYSADSGASFHGDGLRYHVFSYRYEDPVEGMFAWSAEEIETIYYDSCGKAARAWLTELGVPEEWYPDFAVCAVQYRRQEDNSEIILFFDNHVNRLYIVESFL